MKSDRLVLTALLAFSLLPLPTLAATPEQRAFDLGQPLDARQRVELAKQWVPAFHKLNDKIPPLSSSQEQWLSQEFDKNNVPGGDTDRLVAAMVSKEFQIRMAKPGVETNASLISRLANSQFTAPREEAFLWLALAANLVNEEFNQALLALAEMNVIDLALTNDERSSDPRVAAFSRRRLGHLILVRFVAPFLKGGSLD